MKEDLDAANNRILNLELDLDSLEEDLQSVVSQLETEKCKTAEWQHKFGILQSINRLQVSAVEHKYQQTPHTPSPPRGSYTRN